MTDKWYIDKLPTDVLLIIFDYCSIVDLSILDCVCQRFHSIICDDAVWIKRSHWSLIINQFSERFQARCNPLLSLREKWRISNNWIKGKFTKEIIGTERVNSIPWLCLTKDILWWSTGSSLNGYHRPSQKNTRNYMKKNCIYSWNNIVGDICKFVVRDDCIISGHRDGKIWLWSTKPDDDFNYGIEQAHSCSINAIDEVTDAIISGGSDGTIKIWQKNLDVQGVKPMMIHSISDRIWSLGADPDQQKFAVGSSGTQGSSPLRIFDIEYCRETNFLNYNWKYGAGTLDLVWENSNCLLSCGYDTDIKKWDLRIGKCVGAWTDPTDATVYCLSTDHNFTMLTGTQYNGKSVLWDQRQNKYIQLFFIKDLRGKQSPVYSVSFDSSHIYGATDRQLVEFSFLGNHNKTKDYRHMIG